MMNNDYLVVNYLDEQALEKRATREGLGDALVTAAETNAQVSVINADLPSSLRLEEFAQKFPERYVQVGVAEQLMAGVGTGMALYGKIPFITSFAAFSPGLNWSQIRLAAMSEANLKVASSHYGLNVGEDGASAQMLEDVALMRVLPNFKVVTAADYNQAKQTVAAAIAHEGPVYLRFTRSKYPVFMSPDAEFVLGKAQLLRTGTAATVVVTGSLVYETLQAAAALAEAGIELEVINLHTVKPVDIETLEESIAKTGKLVTVEEHAIAGGMGSAVLEALVRSAAVSGSAFDHPALLIGVDDKFGTSGNGEQVLAAYGLDRKSLQVKIQDFLNGTRAN